MFSVLLSVKYCFQLRGKVRELVRSEGPQRRVRITRPFYLGAYEVTQGEYERVMGENPSKFSSTGRGKDRVVDVDTSRFPVETVSWEDAEEFCRRLSALPQERSSGWVYRLPTEAEWEYACRAGTTTRFHVGNALTQRDANFGTGFLNFFVDSQEGSPKRVGSYAPNGLGLYDMHGNVREWCADWYDGDYYAN